MSVAAPTRATKVVGVALFSDEPQRLATFFGEAFGLSFERRAHDDGRVHWVGDLDGLHLEVKATRRDDGSHTPDALPGSGAGAVEVSLQVDDVRQAVHAALAAGARELQPASMHGWGSFAVVLDPDGNRVGLWSPPAAGTAAAATSPSADDTDGDAS